MESATGASYFSPPSPQPVPHPDPRRYPRSHFARRIAVVTTSYPANVGDPAGHFVRGDALRYAREGCAVSVFAPNPGPRDEGIDVHAIGCAAFGWPGVAARLAEAPWRGASAVRWVARVRRELARAGRFDLVVVHWGGALGLAFGGPLHLVSHGADVRLLVALPSPLRRVWVRRLTAVADAWQFVSESLLAELRDSLDPCAARELDHIARVEACPIDFDFDDATRERARASTSGTLYVSVGRLVAEKGVERAIEYVASRRDATLAIVGDGPERATLEAFARNRGANVRFLGLLSRRDALAWIAAADVLLFTSEREGAPSVLREAEALGVRVVDLRARTSR